MSSLNALFDDGYDLKCMEAAFTWISAVSPTYIQGKERAVRSSCSYKMALLVVGKTKLGASL